ncbi:putative oxysterol binding protein [Phaeomoniella chlamydospora]|uniref:Putative oxysterol binding protein n=1 Tax=Phaeomoniella chlamydospora TaxID=158046 RepID=A0A0G2HDX7_PHACM|nr:putative oxysterol binding protein [Phaeomoniella chlamydospora]
MNRGEQVSHHPPVTGYSIWNDKYGIRLQGYNAQKASFTKTINVRQVGHALLSFTPPAAPGSSATPDPETYLITLPSLHIESLITGSPFVELNGFTHISSSTGYIAKIDYSGRGWLSGKKNTFSAFLWKEGEGDEKSPLYTVDGQWNDNFVMREGKKGKEVESYSAKTTKTTPLTVAPIESQDPYESRRAWRNVAASIQKGDMDAASHYKSRIENAQRALRKKEKEENREWERRFFRRIDENEDPEFLKLVKPISGSTKWPGVEADKTGGIWRFDASKAKDAKPPYHAEGVSGLGETEDGTSAPVSRTTTRDSDKQQPQV